MGATRVCRICNKEINATQLLNHSVRCLEIKKLELKLQEVNNWLIDKSEIARKRKNKIGYDTLLKYQKSKGKSGRKKHKGYKKPNIKGEQDAQSLRKSFKSRKCITQYSLGNKLGTTGDLTHDDGVSVMSKEEEKVALQHLIDIKMTQKEGQKPIKKTVFAKLAEKNSQSAQEEDHQTS